jgi:hypothetical protein
MSCMIKRGQLSADYILMASFVMVMIIPAVILLMTADDSDSDVIVLVAKQLVSQAENVYNQGIGSEAFVNEPFPDSVSSIVTQHASGAYELVVLTADTDYAFKSPVPIETALANATGVMRFKLETKSRNSETFVLISKAR